MRTMDFYCGIGSCCSCFTCTRIEQLASEFQCGLDWRPINGVRDLNRRATDSFLDESVSITDDGSCQEKDAKRGAGYSGVPFEDPRGQLKLDPELFLRSGAAAKVLGYVAPYSRLQFEAVFSCTFRAGDEAPCRAIASEAGIEEREFVQTLKFSTTLESLDKTMKTAEASGVTFSQST